MPKKKFCIKSFCFVGLRSTGLTNTSLCNTRRIKYMKYSVHFKMHTYLENINRKSVITIQIWFDSTKLRNQFKNSEIHGKLTQHLTMYMTFDAYMFYSLFVTLLSGKLLCAKSGVSRTTISRCASSVKITVGKA